jgi:hypothetical protein
MDIYNYNIAQYNVDQLINEVYLQINKRLVATYEGQSIDGYFTGYDGSVEFGFYNSLNPTEQGVLTDLISNYVYDANYCEQKKFKINDSNENPSKIDYDILGLNKKRTIVKGELKSVEYYTNYIPTSQTYSDLVVSEFRNYTRDVIGLVQYRDMTCNWILNDGTTGLTLSFRKYYTPEEAIQEGIDRRGNMLSFAKTSLLDGLKAIYGEPLNQTYAFDMLTSVKTQMEYFTQGYTQPLRDAVSASTKAYLTEGIKVAVIEQLTF